MTTTTYLLIAAAGLVLSLIGVFACFVQSEPSEEEKKKKKSKMSWTQPPSEVKVGKPWGIPTAIVGAIMLVIGLMQGLSGVMAGSTPSYVKDAANNQEKLMERQAEHLGVILGKLVPGSNILTIQLPPLPNEQAVLDRRISAIKTTLPEDTLISAIAHADWPDGVTPAAARRMRAGLPSWWTAEDLKSKINSQPFPVGAVVTDMPLPQNLPASRLWKDATLSWPLIVVIDPDPRGLETYLREKIIKAAIVPLPGFNPRAIKEIPDDPEILWNQSKLVITFENLDEIKGKHPNLFAPPSVKFNLR